MKLDVLPIGAFVVSSFTHTGSGSAPTAIPGDAQCSASFQAADEVWGVLLPRDIRALFLLNIQ